MKRSTLLTLLALALLTSPPMHAKNSGKGRSANKFYSLIEFAGGAYADKKNSKCEPGFIGWFQANEDEDPILIIPNDAFRNIKLKCGPEDQKSIEEVSCLERNKIQRYHQLDGKTYTLTLTMAKKEGKVAFFQIRRYLGEKLLRSCLYAPIK